MARSLVSLLHLFRQGLALAPLGVKSGTEDFHGTIPREQTEALEDLLRSLRPKPDRDQEWNYFHLNLLRDVLRGPELQKDARHGEELLHPTPEQLRHVRGRLGKCDSFGEH